MCEGMTGNCFLSVMLLPWVTCRKFMKFHFMNVGLNYITHVAVGKWTKMQNKFFIQAELWLCWCVQNTAKTFNPSEMQDAWLLWNVLLQFLSVRATKNNKYLLCSLEKTHSYRLMQLINHLISFTWQMTSTFMLGATKNRAYMISSLKRITWVVLCRCTAELSLPCS